MPSSFVTRIRIPRIQHDRGHRATADGPAHAQSGAVRATLIHNARAGDHRVPESDELIEAVEKLGWKVTPLDESQIECAVAKPGDVVVVAGGDGTVGRVAKRFAGTKVPVAVVPTGTANNVARTLGMGVEPRSAIASLANAVVRDIDLGVASFGTTTEESFIEGFGVGLFAYVIAERATKKDKKLRRAFGALANELASYEPHRARVEVNGRNVSGDYLLVSVLNLRSLGPALRLAPQAKLDDGELDLVLIRPEHRAALIAHLRRAALELDGDIAALPDFERHRAEHVRIRDYGKWAHVDDRSHALGGAVEVRVAPGAVRFLAPPEPER
jgi:diacylglycerol kinase (ATP)